MLKTVDLNHSQVSPSVTVSQLVLERLKRNGPEIKVPRLQSKDEKVKDQLEIFVPAFINEFIKRLGIYHITAKGGRLSTEALKTEFRTGTTAALVGIAVAQSLLGLLPAITASIRSLSSHYFLSQAKAQKITKAFENVPQGDLSQRLSEAAVEIFQSFECQFMQVTDKAGDKLAMEKLAEDAAARALNYMAEPSNDNNPISSEWITKAVVLGKSEKFFDPSIKNVRIRISGSIVQDFNGVNVNTGNLYEKIGLVVVNIACESNKFYKRKDRPDSARYGYRRLLKWEQEENGELKEVYKSDYQQEVFPKPETESQYRLRRYEYFLQPATMEQESKRILDKIKSRYQTAQETPRVAQGITKPPVFFDLRKPVGNFTGRKELLKELHRVLQSGENTAVVTQVLSALSITLSSPSSGSVYSSGSQASISGLGGIGKTQLALRYAERHAAEYDNNVLWINAETKGDLANSLRKLATKLNIEKKDSYGNEKAIEALVEDIYAYFSDRKSLFIFDNVENYSEFSEFLPKSLLGNKPTILITSRYRNWKNIASVVMLDVLTEEEVKQFLKRELKIKDTGQDGKIKELNTLLQGLPLVLQQVIAYIDNQRNINSAFGINDYLVLYKAESEKILDFNFASYTHDPYAKTVFITWQVTLDKIKKDQAVGATALEILNMMAYLSPDNIANILFSPLVKHEKLIAAIHLLRSYSMINEGSQQDISTIHRLVQQVVRINLESDRESFKAIARKIILLMKEVTIFNTERIFHYLHFLLYMTQHEKLTEELSLHATQKRILDILMYFEDDVTVLLYFFDIAYTIFRKEDYLKFIGEALAAYTRYALLHLLSNTLHYLEKSLEEGKIIKEDIRTVFQYRYKLADKNYRVNRLSAVPEERERQIDAIRLVYNFDLKMFPEQSPLCGSFGKLKKRSAERDCLPFSKENESIENHLKYQKIKLHLQSVSQIAGLVSSGLFAKDALSAMLQGNFSTVAVNFGFLSGAVLLGEVSNKILVQGEILTSAETLLLEKNLSLNNKLALSILIDEEVLTAGSRRFLGNSMKIASPFLGRVTSVLFLHDLNEDIKAYKSGDKDRLPAIVANVMIVGAAGVESGIEVAEFLDLIKGVSEFTGPVGEGIAALAWLGLDVYHVKQQVGAIEKGIRLTVKEKVMQDVRAFFNFSPSEYIKTKSYNTQLIKNAVAFLKQHPDIKHYIFPAACSPTELCQNSEVFLDKQTDLKLEESMPNEPSEGSLFCLSGKPMSVIKPEQWIPIVPYPPFLEQPVATYFCENALGVEYAVNRTGNATLIALEEGDDTVIGSSNSPMIFLINKGKKNYRSGNGGGLFILQGSPIIGTLHGGRGVKIIKLENFHPNPSEYVLVDNQGWMCGKNTSDIMTFQQCDKGLNITSITQIIGRKNKTDIIYMAENVEYVDSRGGQNNTHPDHIYITDKSRNPKVVLKANTVVHSFGTGARLDFVDYTVPNDEVGETVVQLRFTEATPHRFYFDYSLADISDLAINGNNVTFNFFYQQRAFTLVIADPYKAIRLSQNATINYPAFPTNAYYAFQEGAEIKLFNRNKIYVKQHSHKPLAEIVRHYPAMASHLNMMLYVQLPNNETVLIGNKKHEILYNNALVKSHLIGNGGENVYVITPASNADKFPVPEVTLYPVNEAFTDTLDLRGVVQQAKKDCPDQKISPHVSETGQDLILVLNAHYYPLLDRCIALASTWAIATVRLKNAFVDNWYQNLDIFLHSVPMRIIADSQRWILQRLPLFFDSNKEIILISDRDLEEESELVIAKRAGRYAFVSNNATDLIISNALDRHTPQRDFYTLVFSQFYQNPDMQKKVLSTTLTFMDEQMVLKNNEAQINNAISFESITKEYTTQSARSVLNQTSTTSRPLRSKRQASHEAPQETALSKLVIRPSSWFRDRLPLELGTGIVSGVTAAFCDKACEAKPDRAWQLLIAKVCIDSAVSTWRYFVVGPAYALGMEEEDWLGSMTSYFLANVASAGLLQGLYCRLDRSPHLAANWLKKTLRYGFFLYTLGMFFLSKDFNEDKLEAFYNWSTHVVAAMSAACASRRTLTAAGLFKPAVSQSTKTEEDWDHVSGQQNQYFKS